MAHNGGSKFGAFVVGLGIGAVLALLFAPRSGEETREYLRERYEDKRDEAKRRVHEMRDKAEEYGEKGKEFVGRQRESLEAAVEAGKRAYQDEKKRA
jgi:gas vesicle protein